MPAIRRQSDAERRQFWDGFTGRFPAVRWRWGNTFARWRDVPATDLLVSHYITNHSVGVFIRGARGMPAAETAATLPAYSLSLGLEAELGNPDFPFVTALRLETLDPATWAGCYDWLFETGDRYVTTLARLVGGVD